MNPISYVIEKIEELIGHTPHPAIVAVPLGAWTVSNVCDGIAATTGSREFDDAARISMGIGLVGAVGAALTGFHDYAKIPRDRPSHEVATTHGLGNALATTLMTASYVLRTIDHERGNRPGVATRLLALSAGGLSVYTGWLGGKLVEEMGEGVNPMYGRVGVQEHRRMEAQESASL